MLKKRILMSTMAVGLAAVLVGTQTGAPVAAYMSRRDVFDYSVALVEKRSDLIVVKPSVELSIEAQQLIDEINAKLAEVRARIDTGAEALKVEVDLIVAQLDKLIDQLESLANGAVDQAAVWLNAALVDAKGALVSLVEKITYDLEYSVAYGNALKQAELDIEDCEDSGIFDQVESAIAGLGTLLNNTMVKTALSFIGVSVPATIDVAWVNANLAGIETLVNTACGVIGSYCAAIQTQITNINSLLARYSICEGLVESPEAYAHGVADAAAKMAAELAGRLAGEMFDRIISEIDLAGKIGEAKEQIQGMIGDLADGLKAQLNTAKMQLKAFLDETLAGLDAYYNRLLDQKSGLILVSTTTVGGNVGSNSRELTWRDILEGNFDIDAYEVSIDLERYPDCTTSEVQIKHKLTLESTWPTELTIDFSGSFNLPEIRFVPVRIDLGSLIGNMVGLGEFGVSSAWISGFINEWIGGRLVGLAPVFNSHEINFNVHHTFRLPDVSGFLNWAKDTTQIVRRSENCPRLPRTGASSASMTDGSSAAVALDYGAILVATGALGVGGAFYLRKKAVSRR